MANKDELEISIDKEGNVTIKVVGGDGSTCVERTLTENFYEPQQGVEGEIEQQG